MENVNKYIGIPHYFGESSFKKCDCIGLCRLFYRNHGWSHPIEDGKPVDKDHFSEPSVWRRLYKYCLLNMTQVFYDELSFGDFVIFKIDGDLHTGIYLGYGDLLSMQVPTVYGASTSTIYHRAWWTPFFKYAFRKEGLF
ncbi:NlpC/P60 family protein [Mitsuokella multacida]|uniref:NlpC/P60 domain-containing protein n=1 Tax=Mitsuokella multacida DSM 20544 TaxID=500635 RepID=C9KJG1_9FIRM|nr:NlpC/P60 family protein [Mitsuokella multacida]EEX70027.1 hypothetical protein MITSMUL_03160 [Mitsuokella multacida DSM 20544]